MVLPLLFSELGPLLLELPRLVLELSLLLLELPRVPLELFLLLSQRSLCSLRACSVVCLRAPSRGSLGCRVAYKERDGIWVT